MATPQVGEVEDSSPRSAAGLPWIKVAGSYFVTEDGEAWTPIGQNDAVSWPELNGLFRRADMAGVEITSGCRSSGRRPASSARP
ncbi:MAG: hypothetical protein EOQ99_33555 [Mesorhizobium sp.]|nr:MAG: hypothetical protein EOQ99_33555 [Mesorhizobium sp.]